MSVDWYYWPEPSYSVKEDANWKLYEGIDTNPQLGGATLLVEWLRNILRIRGESPYSLASQSCEDLIRKSLSEVLHTNVYLDLFPSFSLSDAGRHCASNQDYFPENKSIQNTSSLNTLSLNTSFLSISPPKRSSVNRSSRNISSKPPAGYIANTLLPSIEEIGAHSGQDKIDPHFWTILKEKTKEESCKTSGEVSSTYLEACFHNSQERVAQHQRLPCG